MISSIANIKAAIIRVSPTFGKPIKVGPNIMIIPINPPTVARNRCHPIISFKKIRARARVNKGIEKLKAVTVAIGTTVRPWHHKITPAHNRLPLKR